MDLDKEVFIMTSELYNNLRFSKTDIQYIIKTFSSFITNVYNPFLCHQVNKNLFNAVDEKVSDKIK